MEKLINDLFPSKIITYRLSDLVHHLSKNNMQNSDLFISIEKDNHSRKFCHFMLDELIIVYQQSTPSERSLYEVISETRRVKLYIDYEYNINNNIDINCSRTGPNCCLKFFQYLLHQEKDNICATIDYTTMALQEVLVLESSTTEKVSYHFVHANPSVIFENNITLGSFMKVTIHYLLYSIANHKCSSFNLNLILQKYSITNLIVLLTPYANVLRYSCHECQLFSGTLSVAEVAHLLVWNSRNQLSLAIDLGVYSKNQQFRLFHCVKKGKNNPLLPCQDFPFYSRFEMSYNDILGKSIVTNIQDEDIPIVILENNQFVYKHMNTKVATIIGNSICGNLHDINTHFRTFFSSSNQCEINSNTNGLNITNPAKEIKLIPTSQHMERFTSFVEKLINSDPSHQGYISSCVKGTKNQDILFFNIGGKFHYCPRIATHHQQNSTAILIDIRNSTYCIRCKDPDCYNAVLLWNTIN